MQIGTVVSVDILGGMLRHVGVVVGTDHVRGHPIVAHISSHSQQAEIVPLSSFLKGSKIWQARQTPSRDAAQLMERFRIIQNKRYDPIRFNCEHLVSYLLSGKPRSPQLTGGVCIIGLLGLAFFARSGRVN